MTRIILQLVLPFLIPLIAIVAWAWLTRGRAEGGTLERLQSGPWFWGIVAGFVMLAGGLVTIAFISGVEPGTRIIAPHFEDGRVVPAQVE